VAERDLVAMLDAADAVGWRSPPGGIEHAPLIALVNAAEQQVLLPVKAALEVIEAEATAAARTSAMQGAALLQQQESIRRSGNSSTSLDGNPDFVGSTCSTMPHTPSQQQEQGIESEIKLGRGMLSPFAGLFHPDSACVDSSPSLPSTSSTSYEYAQKQVGPEPVESKALDARVRSRDEATLQTHKGTRPGIGRVPPTAAAECWGGRSRQSQAPSLNMHQNSSRAKGGCSIVGPTVGEGKLSGCGNGNDTGGGGGGGRTGCGNRAGGGEVRGGTGAGRQTVGGRYSRSQLASSSDCGFGNTTAAQGGETVTERGLRSATRFGRGTGEVTLPAAPPQEAGPGWQQPAPGPAPKKFRRFGSRRKPAAAQKAPNSTAATTKATPP
jgi:hypothetical protein